MSQQSITHAPISSDTSTAAYLRILAIGTFFGLVLTKAEVIHWQRVHDMFLFKEPHMYLVIGTAVVVGMIGMQLIKLFGIKTIEGKPIVHKPKPYHKGVIIGGFMYGIGWAISATCPGPIYTHLGAGEWLSVFALIGAIGGTFLYGYLRPHLPH